MAEASVPTAPLPKRVSGHFFRSLFDQEGTPWSGLLNRLLARLGSFPVRLDIADKRRLPCWAPCAPWRSADSMVSLLVLDVDGGTTVEAAVARCSEVAFALHTTWSHAAEEPRFRVVFPLAQPIPSASWKHHWRGAVHALGLPVDGSCCDATRRFLLPATPSCDAHRLAIVNLDRPALDLARLALPETPSRPVLPAPPVRVPWHVYQRAVSARLRDDSPSRRNLATALGMPVHGSGAAERATGGVCPQCGRASAWFLVAAVRASNARCNHANSCGWSGPLTLLLPGSP